MPERQCELCQRRLPLRESHIIPHFVIEWMKLGGLGYLRRPIQPNRREQDGPKREMLCERCEQKFSAYEKWFAEEVFHPYIRDTTINLSYDDRLYLALASILWRCGVTCHTGRETPHTEWSRRHSDAIAKHLEIWRRYLNGERPADPPSIHCFLTSIGTKHGVQPVVNFNRYIAHSLDFTNADDAESALIYCKFARFILFSPVTPIDESLLEGTRILPTEGILRTPQALREPHIGQFIITRAKRSHELFQSRISPRQRETINEWAAANGEHLMNSDIGALLAADFSATVEPPLTKPTRYGRNMPCPCGSGMKYKKCHGR